MDLREMHRDTLTQAAEGREREVLGYQINIDNYRLAIAEIETNHADDPNMQEFAARLRDLLASSLVEQTKEKIMLKVIKSQLE